MNVLVDTCIWSSVLRRKKPDTLLSEKLKSLIIGGRVSIIGPVRQEILTGVSIKRNFNQLRKYLSFFPDTPLHTLHFEKAAEFSNICRKNGIQGSTIDFLICSVAHLEKLLIFTTDKDFENYQKFIPIRTIEND